MPFFTFRNFLNTLCLLILCTYVVKGQIQGRVINDKQLPIANATVSIKDHNLGTSTDEFGYFTLPDPGPDYGDLVVSAVGYQPHRTTLSDSSDLQSLQIILAEDNLNLNEIVVSASRYGMERKKAPVIVNVLSPKLFTATQSVAMSETLNYQPGVRVENNCQNCGFTQVRMNGMEGAYSQVLINSRAVFSALNSVYGLDQIP